MRKYLSMVLTLSMFFLLAACANDKTVRSSETTLDDEILSDVVAGSNDGSGEGSETEEGSDPGEESGSKENADEGDGPGSEENAGPGGGSGSEENAGPGGGPGSEENAGPGGGPGSEENAGPGGGSGSGEEGLGFAGGYRYIDNVSLPDYAREFYEVLEESTDNDGEKDFLIEDQYFTAGDSTSEHLIDLLTSDHAPYQITHDKERACMYVRKDSDEEPDAVVDNLRTAYDIFQTDHPEVFWLTGNEPDFIYSTVSNGNGKERYYFMVLKFFNDSSYDLRRNYTEQYIREDISRLNQSVENILSNMPDGNVYEKVKYLNNWLVRHNSYQHDGSIAKTGTQAGNNRESISALLGSVGEEGPDCRAYAFAFKVLCDRAQIPCVTVIAGNPYYAWNYVQGGQLWYGVDVTWNDPQMFDGDGNRTAEAAESGYEKEEFLMCGTETVNATDGRTFQESYHTQDKLKYPLAQDMEISRTQYNN